MPSFFMTIPHSGEHVPKQATWLNGLSEPVLMRDVDRYVDQLYAPVLSELEIPHLVASCHRYVIDLNRLPHEFDEDAVSGAGLKSGKQPKGLHWSMTTQGERLIHHPMSMDLHLELVKNHYEPFHQQVQELANKLKSHQVFHIDAHSMPSKGTAMHNDPGEVRADIVISDFHGKSARKDFVDLILQSYRSAGFSVAYNWPYFGGGITQMYGKPEEGHHTVQVEFNRALYMDEESKQKLGTFAEAQRKLSFAVKEVYKGLERLKR